MADNGGNIEVSNGTPPAEQDTNSATADATSSNTQVASDFFKSMLGTLPYPNVLEKYSSSNTIVTLSALSSFEINNPDQTYRQNGSGAVVVLQSGGGAGAKKALTAYETSDKQLEYFIDNIEIKTIMAPTTRTRTTNATVISFEVSEPYSMGLFYQTLQVAVKKAQGDDSAYNRAPFLLSIRFVGYDDDGNVVPTNEVRHFPIQLLNSSLTVDQGGSQYAVRAVAWNETALTNEIQTVKTDTVLTGDNLLTLLQTGAQSLSTVMNERLLDQKDKKQIKSPDQYVFLFPKELASLQAGSNEAGEPVTEEEYMQRLYESISGNEDEVPENFEEFRSKVIALSSGKKQTATEESIKKQADSIAAANKIGQAKITSSFIDQGDVPFGLSKFTYDKDKQVYRSDRLTISNNFKTFTFAEGTSIETIIEELVLVSAYGKSIADFTKEQSDGEIPWFRIDTQVFLNDDKATATATGEHPKLFVYRIYPYFVDASVFKAPNAPSTGIKARSKRAVKEYNYIYTGQNKDILNFEIKLDNTYYKSISSDINEGSTAEKLNTVDSAKSNESVKVQTADGVAGNKSESGSAASLQVNNKHSGSSGGGRGSNTTAVRIARDFHEAIVNSDVDLLTIELEIMGDPFFLADSGQGNYSALPNPLFQKSLTIDNTPSHEQYEVLMLLNFRTPIDYNDGNDGLMSFPEDSQPVKAFSGLYRILQVSNSIAGGQFKQTVRAIRVLNQTSDSEMDAPPNTETVVKPGNLGTTQNNEGASFVGPRRGAQ